MKFSPDIKPSDNVEDRRGGQTFSDSMNQLSNTFLQGVQDTWNDIKDATGYKDSPDSVVKDMLQKAKGDVVNNRMKARGN